MSKITILISCFVLFACTNNVMRRNYTKKSRPPAPQFAPIKKKVALLTMFNESPYGKEDLAITATEELRRELMRTRDFLVDPGAAKLFGPSKEIYASGGARLVQLARKAKMSGVNVVVFGRIIMARVREKSDEIGIVRKTKSYTENKIELRVFDVSSQKEIFTTTINGYADDSTYRFFMNNEEDRLKYRRDLLRYGIKVSVRKAIPKLLKLSTKLDWTGRVARIIGSKIYINAGRLSGLNVGDILKVLTEGQEIYDPETGGLIGYSEGDVKGTLEIIDYFGNDGSIAILHSGGSVVEGDYVKLY